MEHRLQVGVARATITPPVGIVLAGALREGHSRGIERDLTATALVLSDGAAKVALIALDAIRLSPTGARELRERVGSRLGIPVSHVLVNTSHTHAVPDAPDWQEYAAELGPAEAAQVRTYWAGVFDQVVGAAQAADLQQRPARAGVGIGSVRIGVNRRERLPDGTMVLGENPNGVVDPSVGVVRFDALDGRPIALLLNYACHPDVLGPKSDLISPDYVGAARATAEAITGATVVFFQGAAGDIDPRCGIVLGADGVEEMRRLGTELGCEAARVFQGINTSRRRDQRVAWQSAASVVTAWVYTDVSGPSVEFLGATTRTLTMPLRPLPDEEAARRVLSECQAALEATLARPSTLPERLVARRRVRWAELQLDAVLASAKPSLELELQAIRLNDLAIVAVPGELFVEIGLAIKARSPLPHTFVFGYSNGTYFYIPTAEAFQYGGYEVESYRNYHQPAGPTPVWEAILTKAAIELIASLAPVPV